MKENEPSAPKNIIKTYISESNQNKITHTLSVESQQSSQAEADQKDQALAENSQASETATQSQNLPPEAEEPESLNARTLVWQPTSAAADAEAVAGLPVGGRYGQEGDLKAAANQSPVENEKQA